MRIINKLTSIFGHTLNIMLVFSGILVIFAALIINVGIITRTFLNLPIPWVPEISGYILLYITFLVAAWVLKEEGHVKMDIVLSKLSPKGQFMMNTITSAISAIVSLILAWYGAKVTLDLFRTGYFTTSILELPKFIFTISIFVGCFLLSIQFIRRTFGNLTSWKASSGKELEV